MQGRLNIFSQVKNLYALNKEVEFIKICRSENTSFYVKSMNFQGVLRICRPGYHTRDEIESEISWINQLKKDTDLAVPFIHKGIDSSYIQEIVSQEYKNKYYCVLFSCVEGKTLEEIPFCEAAMQFGRIGRTAAVLHNQAAKWSKSKDLPCFIWDYEHMIGARPRFGMWQNAPGLDGKAKAVLSETSRVIKARLHSYGQNDDNFGLIHCDLRFANLILNEGQLYILDFDDMGHGYFLSDYASAFSFIEDNPQIHRYSEKWLEGYLAHRRLSQADLNELDTFIMLRRLMLLGWVTSHNDSNPVEDGIGLHLGAGTLSLAEKYLKKFG